MGPASIALNSHASLNISLNLNAPTATNNPSITAQLLEHIKVTLRASGYSEQATNEITAAMSTLATYGILGMGLGLTGTGGLGSGPPVGNMNSVQASPNMAQQVNNSFRSGGSLSVSPMDSAPSHQTPNGVGNNGVFGPIGTVSGSGLGSGLGNTSPTQRSVDRYGGLQNEGPGFDPFRHQPSPTNLGSPIAPAPLPLNNNSFGLGTQQAMGGLCKSPTPSSDKTGDMKKVDVEVGENIVGAILGPGGKSLVEIQHLSGANIQISKKGTFAPGTRNRIVSISGTPNAISTAQYLIEQRISEEEAKRARHSVLAVLQ